MGRSATILKALACLALALLSCLADGQLASGNSLTGSAADSTDQEPSYPDSLLELGVGYTHNAEDGGVLAAWRSRGAGARRVPGLLPKGSGSPTSSCLPYKDAAFDRLERALLSSGGWIIQQGTVDFGFLGDEKQACTDNCAFNNPSSPYGLTLLPLSPTESQRAKATARTTPKDVADDLRGNGGVASSLSGNATGLSAIYQLLPQEVVLVAGCTPPPEGSAYFAVTPYVHTVWDPTKRRWVSVFGSMGDSSSIVRPQNLTEATSTGVYPRSRLSTVKLRTSLGGTARPLITAFAGALNDATLSEPVAYTSGPFDSFFVAVMTASPAAATAAARILQPALSAMSSSASSVGDSSPNKGAAPTINLLVIPGPKFAEEIGLGPRSSYYMALLRSIVPGGALEPHFKPYAEAGPLQSWRLTPMVPFKELPAGPLNASTAAFLGNTSSNGLMSRLRANRARFSAFGGSSPSSEPKPLMETAQGVPQVLAGDRFDLPDIIQRQRPRGAQGQRLNVSSVTIEAPQLSAAAANWTVEAIVSDAVAGSNIFAAVATSPAEPSVAAGSASGQQAAVRSGGAAGNPAFAARLPGGAEAWLQPALSFLERRIQEMFEKYFALAWSLTTGAPLGALDIDYGMQCLTNFIDFCNGDNRDATYLSSFPFVRLNGPDTMSLVVGIHHVATGMATYMNVALSDPEERLGLQAFDGAQLIGSARPFLVGTPHENVSDYLYVGIFARDCQGIPFCKEIPSDGPRSAPFGRNLLATLRAYVNPATGVGPDPVDLVMFKTVDIVPKNNATAADYRAARDALFFARDSCASALTGQTLCAKGPDPACCSQVQKWVDTGCSCLDTGKELVESLGPSGNVLVTATARMCRLSRFADNSVLKKLC